MIMHRILVCGGRDYADKAKLYTFLDDFAANHTHSITEVVHGGARGADRLAGQWAASRCKNIIIVYADWQKYGYNAGPLRNAQMLRLSPCVVIAFPGGRGTADIVSKANAGGVPVVRVI